MLILPGSPALSAFRKEKLLEALPQVEALSARFVHFVELSPAEGAAGLDERERHVLDSLLEYGPCLETRPWKRAAKPSWWCPARALCRRGHPGPPISTTPASPRWRGWSAALNTGSSSAADGPGRAGGSVARSHGGSGARPAGGRRGAVYPPPAAPLTSVDVIGGGLALAAANAEWGCAGRG